MQNMQEVKISDFANFERKEILKRTRIFYLFRVIGFLVTVIGSLAALFWNIQTKQGINGLIPLLGVIFIGFGMFAISNRTNSFCKLCQKELEEFYCVEVQSNGRYSGSIFVCKHCCACDVRLNIEFD
jgi:hypothetical protein